MGGVLRRRYISSQSPFPAPHYFNTDSSTVRPSPSPVTSPVTDVTQVSSPLPLFLPDSQEELIQWSQSRSVSRNVRTVDSRASNRTASRASTRRMLVPGDDDLDHLRTLDTTKKGFRFNGMTFWLTWSQLGDVPNSALDEKIASFGDLIAGVYTTHSSFLF